MTDPRMMKLADLLVNYSAEVRKGDLVRIVGATTAEPLLVEVYKATVKAGGNPYLQLTSSDAEEAFLKLANDEQLDYVNPVAKYEAGVMDCMISTWGSDNTKNLTNVDPKKQARASSARKAIMKPFFKRMAIPRDKPGCLRWVGTQFPCQSSAQDAEMSLAEYEDFVFRAGLLHLPNPAAAWRKISERQERVCDYLNKVREVHIRSASGTDIRLGVKGRRWINCDGHSNFPDGEVFTSPIEDATEGVVCYSFPAVHRGREVDGIRLVFKAGRVVDCSATKNEDYLIAMLDQDKGARTLGELAIGTNYQIKRYMKNTLFDEKIGGTFHMAVGAAFPESGGKNHSGLHWDMVCDLRRGGVIEADGKAISRDGRFLNAAWPAPEKGQR